jgi:hypothetical protein
LPKYRDKGDVSIYGHAKADPSGHNTEDNMVGIEEENKKACKEKGKGKMEKET